MSTYVIAIDLGTTKVVGIVGEKISNNRYRILAYDEAESDGVKRGAVENIHSVMEAVKPVLKNIKEKTGITEIKDVFVGVAGQHIKYTENRADTTRDKYEEEISEEEVKLLESNAYKLHLEPGEEVLHAIPQTYSIDGVNNIVDPVGRLGRKLVGHFHVIIGNTASISHTQICMKRLDLNIEKLILEPIASARATLTDDEKEVGVAMVDMGGGTTDLVVYHEGIIRHTAVISLGGNVITDDIKTGCGILARQAEQIKLQFGSCLASMAPDNKIITVPGIQGRDPREISFKALASIIEARMEEIIGMVLFEIKRYDKKLNAGIVFTGGGSQIAHLPQFIKLKTGMDVRIGKPEYTTTDSAKDINQPKYSTAAGLVMCGFDFLEGNVQKGEVKIATPNPEPIVNGTGGEKTGPIQTVVDAFKDFFKAKDEV